MLSWDKGGVGDCSPGSNRVFNGIANLSGRLQNVGLQQGMQIGRLLY